VLEGREKSQFGQDRRENAKNIGCCGFGRMEEGGYRFFTTFSNFPDFF